MNIIFNKELVEELKEKYTILELDTVLQPNMIEPLTLFAVVEITNITDLSTLSFFREMHGDMIKEYKSGNWERAVELTNGLIGHFNGELDEFYNLVIDFCVESAKVNRIWDGVKHTVPVE